MLGILEDEDHEKVHRNAYDTTLYAYFNLRPADCQWPQFELVSQGFIELVKHSIRHHCSKQKGKTARESLTSCEGIVTRPCEH